MVTAEETSSQFRLKFAGFWIRVLAGIIDGIILIFPILFIMWLIFTLLKIDLVTIADYFFHSQDYNSTLSVEADLTMQDMVYYYFVIVSLAIWVYGIIFEGSKLQATLGKMLFGLKVIDNTGNKISFTKAAGRNIGKIFPFYLISIFMVGLTKKKQGIHDKMVKTYVIYVK